MIYEPYSIVVVPFPFTDKVEIKRRPALILSSKTHQEDVEHVTLMMITSAKHNVWESDYHITKLTNTGLHNASIVRQKLFTIDSRLIIDSIGKLAEPDVKKVKTLLKKQLSLK